MNQKAKVLLPILLFIYILIETILKSYNIELCSSTGCKMAGSLLKFDSIYLNYLGMLGAFILIILAFFKSNSANILYTTVAVAMVIFESILIASQLNLNPEPCKFCLGVYTFLLLILLNANFKVFLGVIPAILAVFLSFYILAIPKNKSLITQDGLYLIASKTCPHCKKTKEYLDKNGIKYKILQANDINSFYLAKSLGINKIPIAIKKYKNSYKILVGDSEIINSFNKKKEKKEPLRDNIEQNSFDKLDIYGKDTQGCSLSLDAKVSDCESGEENGK